MQTNQSDGRRQALLFTGIAAGTRIGRAARVGLVCLLAIAIAIAVAGCGSGNTTTKASSGVSTAAQSQARQAPSKSTSTNRTQGTIQFLSTGDARSFCGLLPISAVSKLIPGFRSVPLPTLIPHRAMFPASANHAAYTSIVCNYQDGNAALASIWLHLGMVHPALPFSKLAIEDPSGLTRMSVDGHPAAYAVATRAGGHVTLLVDALGATLDIEPYYSSQDPLRVGEQGAGPPELRVAEAVADALLSGKYGEQSSTAPGAAAQAGGPTGLGATVKEWAAHHQPNSFSPTGSGSGSYNGSSGPFVSGSIPEWTSVQVRGGRVDYFWMDFPTGTSQATAVSQVKAQLPSDSVVYVPRLGASDAAGSNCEWFEAKSATLARLLGGPPTNDTNGDVTVILQSPGSPAVYKASNVGLAIITAEPASPDDACNTGEPTN